jgi:hypothetical protein
MARAPGAKLPDDSAQAAHAGFAGMTTRSWIESGQQDSNTNRRRPPAFTATPEGERGMNREDGHAQGSMAEDACRTQEWNLVFE